MSGVVQDSLTVPQYANSTLQPGAWTPSSTRTLTANSGSTAYIDPNSGLNVAVGGSQGSKIELTYTMMPTDLTSLQSIMLNASTNVSVNINTIQLAIWSTFGGTTPTVVSSVKTGLTFFLWNVSDINSNVM